MCAHVCVILLCLSTVAYSDSAGHCRSADKGVNIDQTRNLSASEAAFKLQWRETHVKVKQVDELSFE